MIGSQTAVTWSILSQAARAPEEQSIRPAATAAKILVLRMAFPFCKELFTRPVNQRTFDEQQCEVEPVAHCSGDQNRSVHICQRVRNLRIDDAVTDAVRRTDEH